jgi:hypothetical protein
MAIVNPFYKTPEQVTVERLTPLLEAALRANSSTKNFTVAGMRAIMPSDEQAAFTRPIALQCLMTIGFPQDFEGA